jgi:hypothetical protein
MCPSALILLQVDSDSKHSFAGDSNPGNSSSIRDFEKVLQAALPRSAKSSKLAG